MEVGSLPSARHQRRSTRDRQPSRSQPRKNPASKQWPRNNESLCEKGTGPVVRSTLRAAGATGPVPFSHRPQEVKRRDIPLRHLQRNFRRLGPRRHLSDRVPTRLPGIGGRPLHPGAACRRGERRATGGAAPRPRTAVCALSACIGCWPRRKAFTSTPPTPRCVSAPPPTLASWLAVAETLVGTCWFSVRPRSRRVPTARVRKSAGLGRGHIPPGRADFRRPRRPPMSGAAFTVGDGLYQHHRRSSRADTASRSSQLHAAPGCEGDEHGIAADA